ETIIRKERSHLTQCLERVDEVFQNMPERDDVISSSGVRGLFDRQRLGIQRERFSGILDCPLRYVNSTDIVSMSARADEKMPATSTDIEEPAARLDRADPVDALTIDSKEFAKRFVR